MIKCSLDLDEVTSLCIGMSDFLAPFVNGKCFVQPGNHFSHAGLGEALAGDRVGLLQPLEAFGEAAKFFLGLSVVVAIVVEYGACGAAWRTRIETSLLLR